MIRYLKYILVMGPFLLPFYAASAQSSVEELKPEIVVYMNEFPPFANIVENNNAEGEWVDKVSAYLDQTDLRYEIFIVPWQRAYFSATTEDNILIAHLDRTESRESQFHWLLPITSLTYSLIGLNQPQNIDATLEDVLREENVAVCTKGSAHCDALRKFGFKGEQVWEYIDYDGLYIVDLVINDRADFMLEDLSAIRNGISNRGKDPNSVIAIMPVKEITSYLAASNSIRPDLLERLMKPLNDTDTACGPDSEC